MQEKSPLALKLIALRKERNMSSQAVADAIGIKGPRYRRYEINTQPRFEVLSKIADYFGVSVDYLVAGSSASESLNRVFVCADGKKYTIDKNQMELDDNELKIINSLREMSEEDVREVYNFIDWLKRGR